MLPFWLIKGRLTKMEARNQNPKKYLLRQNMDWKHREGGHNHSSEKGITFIFHHPATLEKTKRF